MISPIAVSEINKMKREGLEPTVADIVRLNAIGLKSDHSAADTPLYQSRRTATIGAVTIQEPTIGHEQFISELKSRGFDTEDAVTFVILRCWVLSHDVDDLPKKWTVEGIRRSVCAFMEANFRRVTFRRMTMALNYVLFGFDSATLENPPAEKVEVEYRTADDEAEDDAWNFALGVIYSGERMGLGISLADARRHTIGEMRLIVEGAMAHHFECANPSCGRRAVENAWRDKWLGRFYDTLSEIRERLEKERDDRSKVETSTIANS